MVLAGLVLVLVMVMVELVVVVKLVAEEVVNRRRRYQRKRWRNV